MHTLRVVGIRLEGDRVISTIAIELSKWHENGKTDTTSRALSQNNTRCSMFNG